MKRMDAPCLNCPKRAVGCHDKCPDYQGYKKRTNAKNAMIRKIREDAYLTEWQRKNMNNRWWR